MSALSNTIEEISKLYPWLTEATMDRCLEVEQAKTMFVRAAVSNLKGKNKEFDEFINEVDRALDDQAADRTERASNFYGVVGRLNDDAIEIIRGFERSESPLTTMGEGFETLSWAAYQGTEALADGTRKVPWLGTITKLANWTTLSVAGLATLGVIMTKFVLEHEKTVRAFIDYGGAAGDLETYTTLRDIYGNIGQSLAETFEIMSGSSSLFANVNGDVLKGYGDFGKLITSITNNPIEMFGYGAEQISTRLLDEAEILRTVSDLRNYDATAQDRIKKGFSTSTRITTMLAESTGESRDSLLAARQEALTDVEMMHAFNRNMSYMKTTYGEKAATNQREFLGLLPGLGNILGPEFSKTVTDSARRGVFDIQHNDTVIDNMPTELISQLQLMGPGMLDKFVAYIDSGIKGDLNPNEAASGWQDIMREMSGSDAIDLMPGDINRQKALDLQARATILPQSFMNFDFNDMGDNNVDAVLKHSGMSIKAMDDAGAALTNLLHKVAPAYGTTGETIDLFNSAVQGMMKHLGAHVDGETRSMVTNPRELGATGEQQIKVFPYGGSIKDAIENPSKYKTESQIIGPGQKVILYIPTNVNVSAINNKVTTQLASAKTTYRRQSLLNNSSASLLTNSVEEITKRFNPNLQGLTT